MPFKATGFSNYASPYRIYYTYPTQDPEVEGLYKHKTYYFNYL